MTGKTMRRFARAPTFAATPLAAALLVLPCAMPAEAGWLARGTGVAGAGDAVKENLEELTDHFSEMFGATMSGNAAKAEAVWAKVEQTPGRLIKNAFPVLKLGDAVLAAKEGVEERLKSAEQKIGRFVGGVGESVADARAALAVGAGERDWYGSGTGILAKAPLPAAAVSGTRAAANSEPKADPWADDTATAGQSGDVWGEDAGEGGRGTHDWASAGTETDPWGHDAGAEWDSPPDVTVAAYDGDGQREAEQWQSEYAVALNRFLGLDDGDDDYEAALSTVERLEREAIRRQEERERQARLQEQERMEAARRQEERERQARLEEQERMEAARRQKERERQERLAAEQRARQRAEASRAAVTSGILTGIQNATSMLQGQMSVIQQLQQQQARQRQLAALERQQARQRRAEQERYQQRLHRQQQEAAEQQRRQADRQARLEQGLRQSLQECGRIAVESGFGDECPIVKVGGSYVLDPGCEERHRQAREKAVQERERKVQECEQRAWSRYKESGGATIFGIGRL